MKAMNKRLLSVVMVLAMVLSMSPVITLPAAAATTDDIATWTTAFEAAEAAGTIAQITTCPFCEGTVTWTALTGTSASQKAPTDGTHYYLAADYSSSTGGNVIDCPSDITACLYLNDHTIQSTNANAGRVVRVRNSTFTIFGDGTVTNPEGCSAANMFDFNEGGTLNIYGGTYVHNGTGSIIEDQSKTYATIYGGKFNADVSALSNVTIGENLVVKNNGDGTYSVTEPVCPGCGAKNVVWEDYAGQHVSEATALTAADGHKHYRLAADYKYDGYGFYMTGGTACFDLGAYNFTRQKNTGSAFYVGAGTLTITGTGLVKGSSVAAVELGSGAATVNLKGGTFTKHVTETGGYRTPPIIKLDAGGTVNMYSGAVIDADGCYNTQFGCVSIIGDAENKATFNMYGGKIVADDPTTGTAGNSRDGSKYPGGAINVGRPSNAGNAELNISGGEVWGDTLTHASAVGGTIYVAAGNKLTVSGNAVIKGGSAPLGGNVYLADGATLELSGTAQITGGVATSNGGNVYAKGATVTMSGGSVTDGTANRGGNIYLSGSAMTMSNGTVSGGNKTNQGVEANVTLRDTSTLKMTGGAIQSVESPTNVGSAVTIRAGGKLILGGTAQIVTETGIAGNANAEKLVFAAADALEQIQIAADWTGEAHIHDGSSHAVGITLPCGQWGSLDADNNFTAGGATPFTGKLYLMGSPIAGDLQGNLIVACISVVNGETETWYATGELAVNAYNALGDTKAYIQVDATGVTLPITGKTYVNNNGNTVTVTGTGTLYGMDSSLDDYAGNGGSFLLADTVTVVRDVQNGNRYIALDHGTDTETGYQIVKSHRLDMKLSTVSLRASKDQNQMGLYYKADLSMDEALAGKIDTYGVVLSLVDMPGADFMTDVNTNDVNENGFTAITDTLGVNAENSYTVTINSGAVFGIMRNDNAVSNADNAARGKLPIYANVYLWIDFNGDKQFDADEFIMADNDTDETNDVAWSLFQVMDTIDTRWSQYDETVQEKITDFYGYWANFGMSDWASELPNIAA